MSMANAMRRKEGGPLGRVILALSKRSRISEHPWCPMGVIHGVLDSHWVHPDLTLDPPTKAPCVHSLSTFR